MVILGPEKGSVDDPFKDVVDTAARDAVVVNPRAQWLVTAPEEAI